MVHERDLFWRGWINQLQDEREREGSSWWYNCWGLGGDLEVEGGKMVGEVGLNGFRWGLAPLMTSNPANSQGSRPVQPKHFRGPKANLQNRALNVHHKQP